MGALKMLGNKFLAVGVRVDATVDGQHLLDIEAHTVGIKLAVLVVYLNSTLAEFVGQEDIFVKHAGHGRGTLVDTAPSLEIAGLSLLFTNHKIYGFLANDEHLFKLHCIVLVVSVQGRLHEVLHLGFGPLTSVRLRKVEGGWDVVWQVGLELNRVDTGLEYAINNIEHAGLVLKELFGVLQLICMVDSPPILTCPCSGSVVTNEGALLTTLDLKLDMRGFDSLHDLHVDDTRDSVAWLVEWVLRLELDFPLGEFSSTVGEEKHSEIF